MLRVTSLAKIILGKWKGENLDSKSIITACALHDLAKPITFDLTKQPKFGMTEMEIQNLEALQQRLKSSYGIDERRVLIKICKELGCTSNTVHIIQNMNWSCASKLLEDNDIGSLVFMYCDMRIGPDGILPLWDRVEDAKTRYSGHDFEGYVRDGIKIEKLIERLTSINLKRVSDDQINDGFNYVLALEI